ncbi:hypothetical protein FRC12_000738 [Ceratobasidium sp. 428]|nr:hypothetical protein FRC12_000738 [Ceratobasidium sp. 428]
MKTPRLAIRPGTEAEVVEIVKFCRDNDMQLTVKNGGHSYAGYSLNEQGVVIYMDKLSQVTINDDCTEVTIAAGAIWKQVYDQFVGENKANIVVGGQCPYVGVSGFTMGGGLSPFSRSYGLGVDNVVEIKVVTAKGDIETIRRVNRDDWPNLDQKEQRRQELLWAICGGGGGNFGVLLEFKSRVHKLNEDDGRVVCGQLTWDLNDEKEREEFCDALVELNNMDCPDALTIDGLWRAENQKLEGHLTVVYNGHMEDCKDAIRRISVYHPDKVPPLNEMIWSDWVYKEDGWGLKSGIYHRHLSFILGEKGITPELVKRVNGLMDQARRRFSKHGKAHFLWGHIGGRTSSYKSNDTPFPWRKGMYVCNLKLSWSKSSYKSDADEYLKVAWSELHGFALEKQAAYLNYIDPELVDWQTAYYGNNYPDLQRIKEEWDPKDFFRFGQAIELPGQSRHTSTVTAIPRAAQSARSITPSRQAIPNVDKQPVARGRERRDHAIRMEKIPEKLAHLRRELSPDGNTRDLAPNRRLRYLTQPSSTLRSDLSSPFDEKSESDSAFSIVSAYPAAAAAADDDDDDDDAALFEVDEEAEYEYEDEAGAKAAVVAVENAELAGENVELCEELGATGRAEPQWAKYAVSNPRPFQNLANMDEDDIYIMMRDVRSKNVEEGAKGEIL